MLLLGKLGWDVSGVTAFDFVDHLMERLEKPTKERRDNAVALRGHALTYVSLCCTGKHLSFSLTLTTLRVCVCFPLFSLLLLFVVVFPGWGEAVRTRSIRVFHRPTVRHGGHGHRSR